MARVARVIVPGLPHHITQRGNNRQDVFFTDDDRRWYLRTLRQQSQGFGLRIVGYCLMTNHVHLLAVPRVKDSLAKALGTTHLLYTRLINRLHGRSGHLWQNRFYSCPMDVSHERAALRYVERNPVRARLVRLAWRYPWSSAAAHCGEADRSGLLDVAVWRRRYNPDAWRAILKQVEDEQMIQRIRSQTFNGRPLAGDHFVAKLEAKLHRRLRPARMGRPSKPKKGRQKW